MDIDKLGSWLTLTANMAVLAGIIFLAIEVRHEGNSVDMQMQDSLADGFNVLAIELATDPGLARIFVVGLNNPDRLTDIEAIQFGMFLRAYINQQNRVFQLHQLGVLSEEEWLLSAEELGAMLSTPGGQLYLHGNQDIPAGLLVSLKPYLGREAKFELMMGRDQSRLK